MKSQENEQSRVYQRRLRILQDEVTVYPVCCEQLSCGRSDQDWLDAVLAGGAKIVQLRDKVSEDRILLEKAKYFRKKTAEAGALFLINDRFDIGLLADADGIHVGQDDLPVEEIRRLAPEWIIGLSCNNISEVRSLGVDVESGKSTVSYYNIGPIYKTDTKEGLSQFIGSEEIIQISSCCSLPFTVIGGIKFNHIEELVGAGATRIAVVTAISKATDMTYETKRWANSILSASRL